MNHQLDRIRRDPFTCDQGRDARLDSARRVAWRAWFLVKGNLATGHVGKHEVGECAADIDAQTITPRRHQKEPILLGGRQRMAQGEIIGQALSCVTL